MLVIQRFLFFYYLLNGVYLDSVLVILLEHHRNIYKAQDMLPYVIYRFKETWENIHLSPIYQ